MYVTVYDLGNYKASYQEKTPFKAEVLGEPYGDNCLDVKSLVTGKEYEIYIDQTEPNEG